MSDRQRHQIITEALQWLGTPYHHQAMVKGVGADCVGFPTGVAKACGLLAPGWRLPYYSPQWHLHNNESVLQRTLDQLGATPLPLEAAQPGDILLFQFGRTTAHTAILLPSATVIHAVLGHCVQEHRLDEDLQARLRCAYAFPGVATRAGA